MKMTTVAVDKYGRVYDLAKEHPSFEMRKAAKKSKTEERCIVINAFAYPVDDLDNLRKRKGKRDGTRPDSSRSHQGTDKSHGPAQEREQET